MQEVQNMYLSKTTLMIILLVTFSLISTSCSSGRQNPVNPSGDGNGNTPFENDESESNRTLLGMYTVEFDTDTMTASVHPNRTLNSHYNITAFIPLDIHLSSYYPSLNSWDVYVTITNPYLKDGYDLRAIIYTDDDGTELTNPDDWTNLWDIPGGLAINPFKAYAQDEPNRIFASQAEHQDRLRIRINPEHAFVNFAIDVSYPGNCNEPYLIDFFGHTRLVETQDANALAQVEVYDWQDDVDSVALYCPAITNETITHFSKFDTNIWRSEIYNNTGAPPGEYTGVVFATSENSAGITLYDFVTIRVKKDVTANWTFFYYVMHSWGSISNNIGEMSQVGSIDGVLNLVMIFDSCYDNGDFILEIQKEPKDSIKVNDMGEVIPPEGIDMADPEVLTSFLRWGMREYPADNYGFILFSHGNGGIYSLPPDWSIFNDMGIWEFSDAIQIALDENPDIDRLEFIGMESCTMSFIEMAYRMHDVCRVGMASEYIMGVSTADFDVILQEFVDNIETYDAYDFASLYVQDVVSHNTGAGTYAAWDSDLVEALVIPEINNFAQELIDALPLYRDEVILCRIASDNWGSFCTDFRITDLGYFAENIMAFDPPLPLELTQAANDLRVAIDTAVFDYAVAYAGEGCYKSATGWQVLFTDRFNDPHPDYQYVRDVITDIGFADATLWDEFLIAYDDNDY
jgi:hypothetical protein